MNLPFKVYENGRESTGAKQDAPDFAAACFSGRRGALAAEATITPLGISMCNLTGGLLGAIEAGALGSLNGSIEKPFMK